MRIAWTPLLLLAAGCFAERLSAPIPEPLSAAAPAQSQIVRKDSVRIADLNWDDIENVEIIKGPPAWQLYAASGCTAVVVIMTKPRVRAGRAP